jgi:hypothetical protein
VKKSRLNGKREREISRKSITDRLIKQREKLLVLREIVRREIQRLTAEACEETPNYIPLMQPLTLLIGILCWASYHSSKRAFTKLTRL